MATKNITITESDWQDLATIGSITFESGSNYTVCVRGAGVCELAFADTKPSIDFLGHIAKANENFNFTYNGEKIWIKRNINATIILVIS